MNKRYNKLELTWIGKDKQPSLEPRILLEDPEKSYGSAKTHNMLIHGDNLLALKALEQAFGGKIKCVYIDPPYNTGNAFAQYDDGVEHSIWLSLMRDRLMLLHRLLADDGSIWISIDDDECHYLKVLCDEIFGRSNFVANVIWQKKYAPQNDAKWLSDSHDHILVFAKRKETWRPNMSPRSSDMDARYKNPDNDPRGPWMSDNLSVKTYNAKADYPITTPTGRVVNPPSGGCWRVDPNRFESMRRDNRIWFGKNGDNVPRIKRFLSEVKEGSVTKTIWLREEVGDNQDSKREVKQFNDKDVFATPKPERLLERIIALSSKPGDWVLDSFAGSATTGAVAHKMERQWIMVELGDHCVTHCIPRMQMVCDGTDQGGVSKNANWVGGGGFKYYEMAPSILEKDSFGMWVINKEYNAAMLAAAMAKHEGFKYCPDQEIYWKQGHSSEKDFIFTTTTHLTAERLTFIHDSMRPDESLLICCKSYFPNAERRHKNITIKKIPSMLLGRCEFGRDDYSLNIINMPSEPDEPTFSPVGPKQSKQIQKPKDNRQFSIFSGPEE